MRNDSYNSASLDTALNGVQGSSEQLSAQLENYKEALAKLTNSPFITKMRALQNSII